MIEQLFGSKTRIKLLHLFYQNSERSFFVREITRKVDEQINSVRRELSNLLSVGVIKSANQNNKLFYQVNEAFGYYKPMKEIFGISSAIIETQATESAPLSIDHEIKDGDSIVPTPKSTNKSPVISEWLKVGNVSAVVYSGQFTSEPKINVDVVIVGDVNVKQVENLLAKIEDKEGLELRYIILTPDELSYRKQINDRFWSILMSAKIQVIIDKDNLFPS
jgi:predicted transcriptional regulator